MAVFEKLGRMIKTLLGESKTAAVDKPEILVTIETLQKNTAALKDALGRPAVTSALSVLHLKGVKNLSPDVVGMQKIYQVYFQDMPAMLQQREREMVFSASLLAIDRIDLDLTLIRENFSTLFGGVDTAELQVEDLTISTAAVLGWMGHLDAYLSWFLYFIGSLDASGQRVPPYQIKFLQAHVAAVARTTSTIATRPVSSTLLSAIAAIKKDGSDLPLITDGTTLEEYADDRLYPAAINEAVSGFWHLSPTLIVGNQINVLRQSAYDRNKARRDWLASKIGYLTLRAQGLDANDPEAKRLAQIVQRYAELVAGYDRKLGVGQDG